jgi:hypothetical protein
MTDKSGKSAEKKPQPHAFNNKIEETLQDRPFEPTEFRPEPRIEPHPPEPPIFKPSPSPPPPPPKKQQKISEKE